MWCTESERFSGKCRRFRLLARFNIAVRGPVAGDIGGFLLGLAAVAAALAHGNTLEELFNISCKGGSRLDDIFIP